MFLTVSHFWPCPIFAGKARNLYSEYSLVKVGSCLSANTRQGQKWLTVRNTLAYNETILTRAFEKSYSTGHRLSMKDIIDKRKGKLTGEKV